MAPSSKFIICMYIYTVCNHHASSPSNLTLSITVCPPSALYLPLTNPSIQSKVAMSKIWVLAPSRFCTSWTACRRAVSDGHSRPQPAATWHSASRWTSTDSRSQLDNPHSPANSSDVLCRSRSCIPPYHLYVASTPMHIFLPSFQFANAYPNFTCKKYCPFRSAAVINHAYTVLFTFIYTCTSVLY